MLDLLFLLATAPAALLAYTVSPSATVLNQLLSIAGWGLLCVAAVRSSGEAAGRQGSPWRPIAPVATALLLYCAAGVAIRAMGVAPGSMVWSTVAVTLAALAVVALGAKHAQADSPEAMNAFCAALVVIGFANVAIALLQVFLPDLPDGTLVAKSGLVGRAVGNLRQPNHLSSLALWSAVALVPLVDRTPKLRWAGIVAFALFVFSVELSASRTGMVGVVVLALWGLVDRRLSLSTRAMLFSAPIVYAIGWAGMTLWATDTHHTFGAAARLGESDISGSRYGIWKNTVALIQQFPLVGVGFGEFNFAWTLSPFPGRPTAFFDHTHNVVLELLVELGLPLGALVAGLLGAGLWSAFRRAWQVADERGAGARSAFVMVGLMALHSQLEYPLWYAYFLLPTAWAWGYALGMAPIKSGVEAKAAPAARAFFPLAGALMVLGSAWACHEYFVVARIFDPADDNRPLEARIEDGRRTIFFAHHADYAAATVADRPSTAWRSFETATHYLLDSRLMMAWANAFAERGDRDRASYLADRLREFRKEDAVDFFAVCDTKPPAGQPQPFQCTRPSRPVDWHEFRDPALYR